MKGYKFVSSQYAEALGRGSVRITPAHLFHSFDGFDDGRSDSMELVQSARPQEGAFTVRSDHPALPDDMFVIIKRGKRVQCEIEMIGTQIDFADNALLYCFSSKVDETICERMKSTFGADALFEIIDVDAFAHLLSCHPSLAGRAFYRGPVVYIDRIHPTKVEELRPATKFEKRKAYSWQQEYRFVWDGEPLADAIQIDVPKAAGLLKRLS